MKMKRRGVTTHTAEEDADYDIVDVASRKCVENTKVFVVGTDTDLLYSYVSSSGSS
jgi:hypothetical protein